MSGVLFALAALACALGFSTLAWWLLGKPEHICPGCDMPDSRCVCEDDR